MARSSAFLLPVVAAWLATAVTGCSAATTKAPSDTSPAPEPQSRAPSSLPKEDPPVIVAGPGGGSAKSAQGEEPASAGKIERPKGLMNRAEAQKYVLALVNRDRAAQGLPPVRWDKIAAESAQHHVDDMAHLGFTGHHGSDGSVPEQRFTDGGGEGAPMENTGCLGDATTRELDPEPRFTAESLERVQATFMAEKPPADGHRRNILTPSHTSLGVALAKVKDFDIACMAQEFVDDYGHYDALPRKAKVGSTIRVSGEIRAPAVFAGVGLSRVDLGKPRKAAELLKLGGYPTPGPFINYFPKGFKTPKEVEVHGNKFSVEIPLSEKGRPGLYGVLVWATFPGSKELKMISLRTIIGEK